MKLRNLLFYLQELTPEQLESTAMLYNPLTKRLNEIDHLGEPQELPSSVREKVNGTVILVTRPQV